MVHVLDAETGANAQTLKTVGEVRDAQECANACIEIENNACFGFEIKTGGDVLRCILLKVLSSVHPIIRNIRWDHYDRAVFC